MTETELKKQTFKIQAPGAGKMAQQIRKLAALAEERTYVGSCEQPVTPAPGIGCLWPPKTPALVSTLSYTYTFKNKDGLILCLYVCI